MARQLCVKKKYAKRYAARLAREMTDKYRELYLSYPCSICKGYHIGHPINEGLKNEQARKGVG